MKKNKKENFENNTLQEKDSCDPSWKENWDYMKTMLEVMHEPILILDKDLKVLHANYSFYDTFQVEQKDTEKKVIYELGNGQWNIPSLKKLLEDILPKNTFFKGFEVIHSFPFIGKKAMLLNARKIHFKKETSSLNFPSIIFLAMEDVTEIMLVAETIAGHTNRVEAKLIEKTFHLEKHMNQLEKEMHELKRNLQL